MQMGFPCSSKFTVLKHENISRGHESFLQSWPDLSDHTVPNSLLGGLWEVSHKRGTLLPEKIFSDDILKSRQWPKNIETPNRGLCREKKTKTPPSITKLGFSHQFSYYLGWLFKTNQNKTPQYLFDMNSSDLNYRTRAENPGKLRIVADSYQNRASTGNLTNGGLQCILTSFHLIISDSWTAWPSWSPGCTFGKPGLT